MDANILHEMDAAFPDSGPPAEDRLVLKASADAPDAGELREEFAGRTWKSLTLEFLRRHTLAIFLMTPEAFRYYLPAYMSVSITNPDEADVIPETLVSALNPSAKVDEAYKTARLTAFDAAQKRVIASFLGFLAEHYGEEEFPGLGAIQAFYAK
jgi:hypothetical protein